MVSAMRKRHSGGHRIERPKPVALCEACEGDGYYVIRSGDRTIGRIICKVCNGSGRLVE